MKYILFISTMFIATAAVAGSGMGGGTPPAREVLMNELVSAELGRAGLFDTGAGDVGLLAKSKLLPELSVTRLQMRSLAPRSLVLPEADFSLLRDRTRPIDAMGIDGGKASYNVESGDTLDTVVLKDRREIMREAVAK